MRPEERGSLRKSPFMQDGRKVELGGVGKEWLDMDCSLREECVRKGCEELFSAGVAGAGW